MIRLASGVLLAGLLALFAISDSADAKDRKTTRSRKKGSSSRTDYTRKIPSDLPDGSKKLLDGAIAAYKKAFKSQKGRDKLFKTAVKKLRAATKDKHLKKVPRPFFYLGSAFNQMRNVSQALKPLETACSLEKNFYQAHTLYGEVLNLDGESTKALDHFSKALKVHSSYTRALKGKAETLVKLGRYKEADKFARSAFTKIKDPKSEVSQYLRGLVYTLRSEIKGTGWREEFIAETRNYKVITSVSQEFADDIAAHAEVIRRTYMKIFQNIKRPERKYEIVVHKSKSAYHKAGGPQMAAGHYSPLIRKLYLYKNPKKKDTLIVLYHEAFHQFLHEYLALAPQWFNEGLGDYFAPFEYIKRGKKESMRSHSNPWRIQLIKHRIRTGQHPAPEELMQMTRNEMYSGDPGTHYAMAWSLIYFMLEEGSYSKVLVKYFQALRKGRGRDGAFDDTFAKIDMLKFTERWKKFTLSI